MVVVDNDTKIATLLSQRPRPLTHIVSIRPVKPELVQRAKDAGIKVSRFTEVEKLGAAANIKETVRIEARVAKEGEWGKRWVENKGIGDRKPEKLWGGRPESRWSCVEQR